MPHSAAVLCHDKRSLQTLKTTLAELDTELVNCPSGQAALELVMTGQASTLIVDFDLPGADEIIRMASLLPPASEAYAAGDCLPRVAGHGAGLPVWRQPHPVSAGRTRADQRGGQGGQEIEEIQPPQSYPLRCEDAGLSGRWRAERCPASASISASTASPCRPPKPCPWPRTWRSVASFPALDVTLQGHADVIWASDQGRAGLFFSKLVCRQPANI